jgi:cyclopropane fatty-acyl-phospholipid synthase-like methyltransferase
MTDPTHSTWNKVAGLYAEKFMDLTIYNESYDVFSSLIRQPAARILDIGCGPGNCSRYLHRKNPGWTFHGVDVAPNMIRLYQENIPEAHVTVMDIRNIHELQSGYDGIIGGFCIPYLNAAESASLSSSVKQLLNPGGVFYLSFVEGDPNNSGLRTASTGDQTYFYYHSLSAITAALQSAGFTLFQTSTVLYPQTPETFESHTILICH